MLGVYYLMTSDLSLGSFINQWVCKSLLHKSFMHLLLVDLGPIYNFGVKSINIHFSVWENLLVAKDIL